MPRKLHIPFRRERQGSPSGKALPERQASPAPQDPKKYYWELATLRLQQDEPTIFEALQKMLEDQDPKVGDLQEQLSSTVQKHKETMEERQWTLPFKVRGRYVKIRGQLDSIMKVLQATKDLGFAIAGLDPNHAGIPWTAVNLIVAGALNDSEQYAAALDGLAQILPLVARYAEIELIYLNSVNTGLRKDFEKCLVTFHASVLKYQISAGCHCQKTTFVRFLRSIPKLDAWASMLQDIKSNDNACKEFTVISDSQDQRIALFDLQDLVKSQEERMLECGRKLDDFVDERKRQDNARILQWICDVITRRDHQDILVTAKMVSEYKESGNWLRRDPTFATFMAVEGLQGPPVWLSGSGMRTQKWLGHFTDCLLEIVGMGKTSLVCRIIEWCIENARNKISGQVAYFYCSGKKGQSQSLGTDPAVIFKSLVRQLAWTIDGNVAWPVLDSYKRMSGERPQDSDFSLEESSAVLIQLINALPDTTIIVDALDECAHPYKLLRALKNLRNETVGNMRFLVSGRDHIEVSSIIRECERIQLEINSTDDDVHDFIVKEVKHGEKQLLRGTEPALEDRLIEILSTKAQGK